MKYVLCLSALLLFYTQARAQFGITGFQFSTQNSSIKSLSLGNATVSMGGKYNDFHTNPAGFNAEENTLIISGNREKYVKKLGITWKVNDVSGMYGWGKSDVAFSIRTIQSGEQATSATRSGLLAEKFNNRELFMTASYSYSPGKRLNIGAALNYLYSGEAAAAIGRGIAYSQYMESTDAWSIDLGVQYETREISTELLKLRPSLGLSLTDFGKPVDGYYGEGTSPSLPTTLRAGVGLELKSSRKVYGKTLAELTLLQSASKILARREKVVSESGVDFKPMSPFKALFNSWGSYEYYDRNRINSARPIEQIGFHSGIEATLLETLSIRWGYENAAKPQEQFSYRSIGFGIDFYYVEIDFNSVSATDGGSNHLEGYHWQITGRIPLNGQRPDTILDILF